MPLGAAGLLTALHMVRAKLGALKPWGAAQGEARAGFFLFVLILGVFMAFPSELNTVSWAWGFVVWQRERVAAAGLLELVGKELLSGCAEPAAACRDPGQKRASPATKPPG